MQQGYYSSFPSNHRFQLLQLELTPNLELVTLILVDTKIMQKLFCRKPGSQSPPHHYACSRLQRNKTSKIWSMNTLQGSILSRCIDPSQISQQIGGCTGARRTVSVGKAGSTKNRAILQSIEYGCIHAPTDWTNKIYEHRNCQFLVQISPIILSPSLSASQIKIGDINKKLIML